MTAKNSNTLIDILTKTTDWFSQRGVPNPRLDAELIIAHVLKKKRMELYLEFDKPLYEADLVPIRGLMARRGQREPLQHILGVTGFRYLEVKCTPAALIPRPETEVLVDIFFAQISAQINAQASVQVLEIGVGTGVIALAIAQEAKPELSIKMTGVDISQEALSLAQENARMNHIDTIEWLESDLFSSIPSQCFDVIISNPPYISQSDMDDLEPEVKDYDPHLALVGGVNGLELPQKLILDSIPFLKRGSKIILELGPGQVDELETWTKAQDFGSWHAHCNKFRDLNQLQRFLVLSFS